MDKNVGLCLYMTKSGTTLTLGIKMVNIQFFQTTKNIYFKLSTTGQGVNSDILNLTAVSEDPNKDSFEVFIFSNQIISRKSKNLHGIFFDGNQFYQWKNSEAEMLQMANPRDAFENFFCLDWIYQRKHWNPHQAGEPRCSLLSYPSPGNCSKNLK